jgi:PAS domain S-box-containing protein
VKLLPASFDGLRAPRSWRRAVPWGGALLIGVIIAFAAFDIVGGYRDAVAQTGRELDTQARIIAEQTARSVQAVDVVLRHIQDQVRLGTVEQMNPAEQYAYLREQSVGLVQITGLFLVGRDGIPTANSLGFPLSDARPDLSGSASFRAARDDPTPHLVIGSVATSPVDQALVFPILRRLENARGEFAGAVGARGRVDYFEQFYRAIQSETSTKISLLRRDGTLLARQPRANAVLGKQLPLADLDAASGATPNGTMRTVSPIDGIDRFAALQAVPEYALTVVITRDAAAALAPWRAAAVSSAVRTLALAAVASVLLVLVLRQLARLDAARASLEAARERFSLAVSGADVGIWDWTQDDDRMYGSPRARELLGMGPGPETESARDWFGLIQAHPDDEAIRWEGLSAHLAGKTPAYEEEFRVLHRDGVYHWVRVRGVCVRDAAGQAVRMAGSISDVDTRRRAEEALRQSEERYQLAVAGSNEGLWDWDLRRDLLFMSPRAQVLLGREPGEPLRPRREWIASGQYHPEDAKLMRKALSDHLRGSSPHFSCEYRIRHASGEWRWYRQRGVAVRDARGRPYRVAGSMEDVTDRRVAEADRDRLEAQLRQAQKLEAIGTLAGGIAHDFNNILAAILGYGEMAQKEAVEGTSQRRHIDAAMSAAWRAKSLVERILAFSRSGVGERVPVHVGTIVGEALDVIAASLPAGVVLERHIAVGDAAVMGDPTQLHQVVMNLCANAVQAMRSSGLLRVEVETVAPVEPHVVTTSTLPPGPYVRLVVRDTGTGIAPRVLERIFDPFFTTKEVGVGTGLGLSLVHGIVTDLGGGIDVHSELDRGTTFTVYVPWQRSVAAPAAAPISVPPGAGETVLIVDDEEALVRLGEEMMAELGYEPVGFASSNAALASFRATPDRFQAILSDESMPEMTGSELAGEIRRLRPDIPILLMTGYITPALAARAKEMGVHEVLAKPLVMGDIAVSLARALRG